MHIPSVWDVNIPDLEPWVGLEETNVSGLTARGAVYPGLWVTTKSEAPDPEHLEWLRSLPFGFHKVRILDGINPVSSVIEDDDTLDELVGNLQRGGKLRLFSCMRGTSEHALLRVLRRDMRITLDDLLSKVVGNDPRISHLADKIPQRSLAVRAGKGDLFLPYTVVKPNEGDLLRASQQLHDKTGAIRFLVRVDGQASGDGRQVYPDLTFEDILTELSGFSPETLIVEPYVEHISASTLLMVTESGVEVLAQTHQLTSPCPQTGWPRWKGNLILSEAYNGHPLHPHIPKMKEVSLEMGRLFLEERIRGPVSVDQLVSRQIHTITESNIRDGNGGVAQALKVQIDEHYGSDLVVSANKFESAANKINTFSELREAVGDLLYHPQSPHGLIPLVCKTMPKQCIIALVAEDLESYQDLLTRTWHLLRCEGEVPSVLSPVVTQ
jgi:hypothetical protein